MRMRLLTVSLVLVGLIAGGAVVWRLFTPRLLEVSPAPGAAQVPTRSLLKLTFTLPLALQSIQSHLRIQPDQPGSLAWEGNSLVFTPNRPWPEGAMVTVQLLPGAKAAGFPWLPLRQGKTWSFQVGQAMLAYLWPSDGPADLYALNPADGEVIRLSENAAILDYSLGPNASSFYLSSNDGQSGSHIQRLDLSQGLPQPGQALIPSVVVECPAALCRLAQASPDGAWLAYERIPLEAGSDTPSGEVWLYSTANQQAQPAGEPGHTTSNPAWSADGWLAFYDQQVQGYVLFQPPDGPRLILENQTGEAGAWQPDGAAFVAVEVFIEEASGLLEPVATSHLIRYGLTGAAQSSRTDLSQAFDLEDITPMFSPDGTKLAFARRYLDPGRWTPGRQLWVMNADGSQAQPLTNAPALNHHSFAWKPDGSLIAFVRSDPTQLTQPPELWIMDADGTHPVQLVIGGYAPVWIP